MPCHYTDSAGPPLLHPSSPVGLIARYSFSATGSPLIVHKLTTWTAVLHRTVYRTRLLPLMVWIGVLFVWSSRSSTITSWRISSAQSVSLAKSSLNVRSVNRRTWHTTWAKFTAGLPCGRWYPKHRPRTSAWEDILANQSARVDMIGFTSGSCLCRPWWWHFGRRLVLPRQALGQLFDVGHHDQSTRILEGSNMNTLLVTKLRDSDVLSSSQMWRVTFEVED